MSIPTDNDGFITLQCHFCSDRFKLTASDFEREDILDIFCPYCGLPNEPSSFLTDEVIEQAHVVAINYTKSLLNKFVKDLEKGYRRNKDVSFKSEKPLEMEDDKVLFEREELEISELKCCQLTVKTKLLGREIGIYCPCCGVR